MPPRINRKYANNKGNPSTINPFGRGFVMAALNINSLLAHLDDLKVFVLDSKIDVLAINETKIDSSVNDNEIYLPGFEVVRKDRSVNGRSGGGVCIYLRSNINQTRSVTIYVMTNLNALSSKLSDPTPDLSLSVRGINLQILPKISFGNLSL